MLLASILSQDIKEAAMETTLLDFSIQSLPADKIMPLSAFIIRITNKIRMYIIPVISGAAGSSIILSDNLFTDGIMLNLLAVLFITEDFNMFASLLLSPDQKRLGDELAQKARNEGYDKYSSWFGIVHSIIVPSTMVLLTVRMHHLMKLIKDEKMECQGNIFIYIMYIMLLPFLSMLVVWTITSDETERNMIRNVLELSRYLMSSCLYMMCALLFTWTYYGESIVWRIIVCAVLVFW